MKGTIHLLAILFILTATSCVVGEVQAPKDESGATVAPEVTSVIPAEGPIFGGTTLTLTGSAFATGMTISLSGVACGSINVSSNTSATCVTNAHTVGPKNIRVVTTDDLSSTLNNAFTYLGPPTITNISPALGSVAGGTNLTITGTGFRPGVVIRIGGALCASYSYVSPTQATCQTPAQAAGIVSATAQNTDTQTSAPAGTFEFAVLPNPTAVNLSAGQVAGTTAIQITGTDFIAPVSVTVAGVPCMGVPVVTGSTLIDCNTGNAGTPRSGDIVVTNTGSGLSGTLSNAYTYQNPPTITSLSPAGGNAGDTITVVGTGFDIANGFTITLGGSACNVIAGATATTFQCITTAGGPGAVNVLITNNDAEAQSVTQVGGFTYQNGPTLTTVAADNGVSAAGDTGGGTNLTLTGTDFILGATVQIGGNPCAILTYTIPTTITCTAPASTLPGLSGQVDVRVTNPDGQWMELANSYTYQVAPRVDSITPNGGNPAGTYSVTITGADFDTTNGIQAEIGGNACTPVTSLTATSFDCTAPAGGVGQRDVLVRNVDGDLQSNTLTNGFTYQNPPAITTTFPTGGRFLGGNTITINGSGFLLGVRAFIDGTECITLNYLSSSSLSCVVPTGTIGPADVRVLNPDTQESTSVGLYTYQGAPTITSITPDAGRSLGLFQITILGSNFFAGASVEINSTSCTAVIVDNPGQIRCTVPSLSNGTYNVRILNTDTQEVTLANAFTYQSAPTITSVSPNIIPDDGSATIVITGTGFDTSNGLNQVLIGTNACTVTPPHTSTTINCTPVAQAAGLYHVTVTNNDGGTQQTISLNAITLLDAPTVTSVSPTGGPTTGGTRITITGTNFHANPNHIQIDGIDCTNISVNSATEIECDTPVGSLGAKTIEVENIDGQSGNLAAAFTYAAAPTITSIVPNAGQIIGGTTVVITGTDFVSGVGHSVSIGGVDCPINTSVPTSINCTTGGHTAGNKDVVITNPDSQSVTSSNGYRYQAAPTVTSMTPSIGSSLGGQAVTITGTGFDTTNGISSVTLNGAACTGIVAVSSTQITCTTGAGTAGIGNIVVTNNDGDLQSGSFTNGYIYIDPPIVTSIAPTNGPAAGLTAVTITGSNFSGASPVTASIGGAACTSPTVVNDTTITCTTGAATAGTYAVSVTGFDSQVGTSGNIYTYDPAPRIDSIDRTTSQLTGGTTLTITGQFFDTPPPTIKVGLGAGADDCAYGVGTSLSFTCTLPNKAGLPGTYDVAVTNTDGQSSTLSNAIEYINPPTIASVSPSVISTAGGAIVINGTGFSGTVTAEVNNVACTGATVGGGGTTITCTAPVLAAASYAVDIINGDEDAQTALLASAINYVDAPTFVSVAPTNGPITAGTAITITGTNFVAAPLPDVEVGGTDCTNIVVVSPTQITCDTPAGTAGAADITITQYSTISVNSVGAFTYDPPPSVTSVLPVTGDQAGGTVITITGTDFQNAPTTITVGGVNCTPIVFTNATTISCTTTGPGPTGTASNIIVTNADGQVGTGTALFTYLDPPSLTSISPTNDAVGATPTITLTGTDFDAPSAITIGGLACAPITVVNSTQVTCNANAGLTGTTSHDVVITNSDGQTSTLSNGYTAEAVPTITANSPTSGTQSGGTTVTITGTNFEAGAVVYFGATSVTPVSITATTIVVTAPTNASTGAVNIRVVNLTAQEVTSAGAFTYTPPAPELEWQVGVASPNPPNPDIYAPGAYINEGHTYTLRNVGAVTSATITITLGGVDSGSFFKQPAGGGDDCSGNTLAPGATCEVDVIFLGGVIATMGTYNATLDASDGAVSDSNVLQGTLP